MNKTVNKETDDNIEESVKNLSELSQQIESIKKQKTNNVDNTKENTLEKPFCSGIIVPKPDDREGPSTGEIQDGEVCIWIKNKTTNEYFYQWLNYPSSENEYIKHNEYIRLCKYLSIKTDEPMDVLYKDVPLSADNIESSDDVSLNLPEQGTHISKIKHKGLRNILNLKYSLLDKASLIISANIIIYYLLIQYSVISFPDYIPLSGQESVSLGYSVELGFLIFMAYCLFLVFVAIMNLHFSVKYIPSSINKVSNTIKSKANKLIEDEYIE